MNQHGKLKVLVAVDGTGRSLKTIHYLRAVRSFRKMHVVLFNVFSSVPDAYWDLEKEPASVKMVSHVRAWEATQRKAMQIPLRYDCRGPPGTFAGGGLLHRPGEQ